MRIERSDLITAGICAAGTVSIGYLLYRLLGGKLALPSKRTGREAAKTQTESYGVSYDIESTQVSGDSSVVVCAAV